jgi:hypothetical protein
VITALASLLFPLREIILLVMVSKGLSVPSTVSYVIALPKCQNQGSLALQLRLASMQTTSGSRTFKYLPEFIDEQNDDPFLIFRGEESELTSARKRSQLKVSALGFKYSTGLSGYCYFRLLSAWNSALAC